MPTPPPTDSAAPGGYSPAAHREACHCQQFPGRWPESFRYPPLGTHATGARPSPAGTQPPLGGRAGAVQRSAASAQTRGSKRPTQRVHPRRRPYGAAGDWVGSGSAGVHGRPHPHHAKWVQRWLSLFLCRQNLRPQKRGRCRSPRPPQRHPWAGCPSSCRLPGLQPGRSE